MVDLSDMDARVYGHKAGVDGIAAFTERDKVHAYRFADAFVKRQNGWQLITSNHRELKPLPVRSCSQASSLKSLNTAPPWDPMHSPVLTFVRFTNATSQAVVINQLNHQDKPEQNEDQKLTLSPGRTTNYHTNVMHPLLVTDVNGKCFGIYQPTEAPSLAVIK